MGEFVERNIPASVAKIVEEKPLEKITEGMKKKPELSPGEIEIVNKIGSVYDDYREKLNKQDQDKVPRFIEKEILPKIPEIPLNSLQKVVNGLIERYGEGKQFNRRDFGDFLFLTLINPTVAAYTEQELKSGKKLEEIKPLQTKMSTKEMLIDNLGRRNPAKSHVIIEGLVGDYLGRDMKGGEIDVFTEHIGKSIGRGMEGGELRIYSEVPDRNFSFSKSNKNGKIYRMEGGKLKQYWPKEGKEKQE